MGLAVRVSLPAQAVRPSARDIPSYSVPHARGEGSERVFGLRVEGRHRNAAGVAHGGLLATSPRVAEAAERSIRAGAALLLLSGSGSHGPLFDRCWPEPGPTGRSGPESRSHTRACAR